MRPTLLVLAAALLAAPLDAQRSAPQGIESAADRVFAQYNSTHTPGCAVGVRQNGRDVLMRGYGMADLESNTPITAQTIFESGSVAKQFTATAIMLLAKDGKLNLDDPVRKYIPELPEYPRPLLLRHLLSHTSGLREWSNLVALAGWPRGVRVHSQADLLEVVTAQKSLNYPVGDFYSYTNSGFALLPTIVERVSGMPFARFSDERIFRPLGLTHTHWRDDFRQVVAGRAQAYARGDGGWTLDMPFENVHGPGGLLTTVDDWLRWNDHLTAKTLGAAVVDSLTVQATLTSGRMISYARGLIVGTYRGTTEIQHSGSTGGYSTFLARYPEQRLSIAVLCNAAGANATGFTHGLVDALVPDLAPVTRRDTVALDAAMAQATAGIYRSTRDHLVMSIGAPLNGGQVTLRKLADGRYLIGNNPVAVEMAPGGHAAALNVIGPDADTVRWVFAASARWNPSAADLATFAGRYATPEVPATWTLRVVGDSLVASVRAGLSVTLSPLYPDAFAGGPILGNVWFTRDAKGAVTAMHSGSARVWDIAFAKLAAGGR